jgi:hypothetical protein
MREGGIKDQALVLLPRPRGIYKDKGIHLSIYAIFMMYKFICISLYTYIYLCIHANVYLFSPATVIEQPIGGIWTPNNDDDDVYLE